MKHHLQLIKSTQHGFATLLRGWGAVLLGAALTQITPVMAEPVNLVRNGDFAAGMNFWVKPPEFGVANPISGGALAVYRPVANYSGPVVSQGIHATDIAGKELTITVDLARIFASSGNSVRVVVEFIRTGGIHQIATVIQPANSSYAPAAAFSPFSGTVTFPADAIKLVKTSIDIVGNGSFKADNLILSGPVTSGPVPVVTTIDPTTVGYGAPITLTGTDFGTTAGTLAVADSSASVVIDSWSDTQVVFHLMHPCHGGLLSLAAYDVMASQTPTLMVSSPHYQLSTTQPSVLAITGQPVVINTWVSFFNGYASPSGITLGVSGAGSAAAFSPNPVTHQGGSKLTFNTTGLAPGIHTFMIQSADGPVVGNSVPFSIDIRTPQQLELLAIDPGTLEYSTVAGTLMITNYNTLDTDYNLRDQQGSDITSATPLVWTSSNPEVMQVLAIQNTNFGPKLLPGSTGTCTLTATAPDGFTKSFPVQVAISPANDIITDIGFSSPVTDNSGAGGPNRFSATCNGGGTIMSINTFGFQPVNATYEYGTTGTMDFQVPNGLSPGIYEFTAENSAFPPVLRSALLSVVNAPGTGMLSGSVAKAFVHQSLKAGILQFHDATTGALMFARDLLAYGDFKLGNIPPGSYRLHFIPDQEQIPVPLDAPWYPNATSFSDAKTLVVAADNTTPNIHFFVFENPQTIEVTAPSILSSSLSDQTFTIRFETTSGLYYTLETSETLAAGSWTPLDTLLGNGGPGMLQDDNAAGSRRFYRIAVTP